ANWLLFPYCFRTQKYQAKLILRATAALGGPRENWSEALMNRLMKLILTAGFLLTGAMAAHAGEADLAIPDLKDGKFDSLGGLSAHDLLLWGSLVIIGTLSISLYQLVQIKKQPAHKSMLDVAEIIFQTCKTYLIQQGKFLLMLFAIIGSAMTYY